MCRFLLGRGASMRMICVVPLILCACGDDKDLNEDSCDNISTEMRGDYEAWCVLMCDTAYRAGVAQGLACEVEPSHYVEVYILDFEQRHPTPTYPEVWPRECRVDFDLICGQAGSHEDAYADSFDYGYYGTWTELDCAGDPVGADLSTATFLENYSAQDPSWYPCPAIPIP